MSRGQKMLDILAKRSIARKSVINAVEEYEDKQIDSGFTDNNNILNEALQNDVVILDSEVLESVTDLHCFTSNQTGNNYVVEFCDFNMIESYIETESEMINETEYSKNTGSTSIKSDVQYSIQTESEVTNETGNNSIIVESTSTQPKVVNKTRIVDYSDSDESSEIFQNESTGQKTKLFVEKENDAVYDNDIAEDGCSSDSYSSEFSNDDGDISDPTSTSSEPSEKIKGKRSEKKESKSNKNKKRRQSGKSYLNYKKQKVENKKVLRNPCLNKKCVNGCNTFTDEERKQIFSLFWNIGNNVEKRSFINGCVNIIPVKRKRTLAEDSRRSLTYQYFFMKGDVQVRVCLQFFLNTLNVTQKLVRNSVQGKIKENRDNRGRHEPKHKATPEQMNEFNSFIESLPAVPSHYCRSSSSKLYLPADVKSIANLHRMYSSVIEGRGKIPLGLSCFKKFFKRDYNIGIHVPKKDKCVKCERYKNIPEEERTEKDKNDYLNHQKEKDDAKQLFLREQSRSSEDGFIVVSFDLQKVLTTPHGPSMMFGFSRKYAVYNFTVYESKSQNGYCYIWEEKDGKRGVNEICTNLHNYLLKVDQDGKHQSLSLFCDNCPGQNKNRFVLAMLLHFLRNSKSVMDISITYLVAGHTYMPVDSVHAIIEKYVSSMNIQAPSEWPTLIRNARRRPRPYEIIPVHFAEFLDWKAMAVPKKFKTTEGREIKIADIKRVRFSKADLKLIDISTSYAPDAPFYKIDWPIRKLQSAPSQIYSSELPINKKKLNNLLGLCRDLTIKKQYHAEYFSLSSNVNVRDELPETDVDDNSNTE